MKIEIADGTIAFPRGNISRDQDRYAFLRGELGSGATTRLVNQKWWHLRFSPESGVAATAIFAGDQLDSVYLLLDIPADAANKWTVDLELQRKAEHDRWLRKELGDPPYKYAWGTISSEFDAKAVVSEIIIAYGR